jgi:hypothetical protein
MDKNQRNLQLLVIQLAELQWAFGIANRQSRGLLNIHSCERIPPHLNVIENADAHISSPARPFMRTLFCLRFR